MKLPYSTTYPADGLFSANIAHFFYAVHMVPAIEQSIENGLSGAVTLKTSQGEFITSYLHELPRIDDQELKDIAKKMHRLSAQILLCDCYEILTKRAATQQSEIMEFFRHIRNACAHDGAFFIRKDLDRPAKWRDKEITREMHGNPLFDFIAIGDVLLFLRDVEDQVLPNTSSWKIINQKVSAEAESGQ